MPTQDLKLEALAKLRWEDDEEGLSRERAFRLPNPRMLASGLFLGRFPSSDDDWP